MAMSVSHCVINAEQSRALTGIVLTTVLHYAAACDG